MPVSRNAHHCQFWDTPLVRTKSVTRFGVSVEKVVATIEVPISHHGAERPDAKNSAVPLLALRAKKSAGAKAAARQITITTQSIEASCIEWGPFRCRNSSGSVALQARVGENGEVKPTSIEVES